MVKSMFAGVAGLRAHQSKMDVIGNNIANVNTWGYKSANMSFKDAMYQSTSSGSAGSTENGGYGAVNANQVGYGVTTGSIAYDFGTGGMSPSANGLDCMIDGTGFFLVGPMLSDGRISLDTEDAVKSSGLYLSRVGKFKVDPNGYLVDDSGNYVYGFQNTKFETTVLDKTALSPIKLPTNAEMEGVTKGKGNTALANAKAALENAQAAVNSAIISAGNARQEYFEAKALYDNAYNNIQFDATMTPTSIGKLIDDTNTLKETMDKLYSEYKNDTTGDKSKLESYTTAKLEYDKKSFELLRAKSKVNLLKPLDGDYPDEASLKKVIDDYATAYSALQQGDPTDSDPSKPKYADLKKALADATVELTKAQTFLSKIDSGSLQGILTTKELNVASEDSKLKAAQDALTSADTSYQRALEANSKSQGTTSSKPDEAAEFSNYKIQEDGTIVGTTSDNATVVIGKIALGSVPNTGGLEKNSGYYYTIGASAGNVSVNEAGGTEGRILGNYLEMAKVDLATEMTDMITTQRGFQANSKIITVTDQMLEELVNLKR
uniref:flagellar hook-basal body complex protein n=1 Tax=Clostridium sp. 12(A) TaxID=1163671 RepID=UPI000467BDCA|nr:flagellar hook-basal body complex protein [Clostridium sp. 12(A)]